MKKLFAILALLVCAVGFVSAGDYSKDSKQMAAAPPCPQWYGDNEWNVNLWGTYLFTNTAYDPNLWLVDVTQSTSEGHSVLGTFDRYVGGDHAWGGGGDIKYFFYRYFGLGVQGFVVDAHKTGFDIFEDQGTGVFTRIKTRHERAIGAVMGTFTIRYPIPCSRIAPYMWTGAGAIFGGGESDQLNTVGPPDAFLVDAHTNHTGPNSQWLAQFGGGFEFRITRNIGWTNDLSWGVISGPRNNFGMFRTGLNIAF